MRRFVIMAALTGGPFGLLWGWLTGFGLGLGAVAGLLFGVAVASVEVFMHRRLLTAPPDVSGERVIHLSLANHFRGKESVGGRLVLTDERLVFKPHPINVQKGEWSVPLSDVVGIEPRRTWRVLPNGVRLWTKSGEERFVVEDRARWISELQQVASGPAS